MNKKEELLKFYNQNDEYFRLTEQGHLLKTIFPIHQKILDQCKQKSGLLVDLGCGTGLDILSMLGPNNFCLGLDISQLAINKALERKPDGKNVDFKQVDLEKIPLGKESVDIITSFFTFEHLFNSEIVLNEIDRILKKQGEVFIFCPNYSSPFRGAPVFGGVHKVKILKKIILSLARFLKVRLLRDKSFKIKMIKTELIDLNKIGEDWDATNEPSMFEFVNYFKRKEYKVDFQTWLSPAKTGTEKFFSNFKKWPIVKYWGPICYVYARKK